MALSRFTATATTVGDVAAVEISVSDEGIGMSPSAREFAFEEFTQIDSSDTRSFGGLGLGLSLVRGVAHAHGGSAWCGPGASAGTRVAISIPSIAG